MNIIPEEPGSVDQKQEGMFTHNKEVKQRARIFLITKTSLKNIFHSQLGLHAEANNFHCELVDYKVSKATIKEHCSTLILTRGITIMTIVQIWQCEAKLCHVSCLLFHVFTWQTGSFQRGKKWHHWLNMILSILSWLIVIINLTESGMK